MAQHSESRQMLGSFEGCTDINGQIIDGCGVYEVRVAIIEYKTELFSQLVLDNPTISNKHVRVYSIHYDSEIEPLIYAQDISTNGTFWLHNDGKEWRERFIGLGNQVLLSQGDRLRLSHSPGLCLEFRSHALDLPAKHDRVQDIEMRSFSHLYTVTPRRLGFGAQGDVLLAISQTDDRQFACKKIDLRKARLLYESLRNTAGTRIEFAEHENEDSECSNSTGVEEKWLREVNILRRTSHPNIIAVHKVFRSGNNLYILQDLLSGGDLFSYIEYKEGRLKEEEAAFMLFQILHAVKYLHEEGIVHRDLKPANILLTSRNDNARVVVTDFGHAISLKDVGQSRKRRMDSLVGTADFAAPEVYQKNNENAQIGYTRAIDMWSVGCVMTALLTGQSYFDDSQNSAMRHNSSEALRKAAAQCDLQRLDHGRQWEHVSIAAKDLVRKLLVRDETARFRVEQALKHGWFTIDVQGICFEEKYRRVVTSWPRHYKMIAFEECLEPWIDFDLRYREPSRLMPPPPPPLPSQKHLIALGRLPPPPPPLLSQRHPQALGKSPYFRNSREPKAKDTQSSDRSPLQDTAPQSSYTSRSQAKQNSDISSNKRRRSSIFDYEDHKIRIEVAKENSPWVTALDYGQKVNSKYQEHRSWNQASPLC